MKRRMVFPRDERGQVMVFALFTIIFLLVIGGLAVDLAWQYTVRNELQSSMDAAALAAAAKLGFNATPFPTVRNFALDFADKNAYHVGTVTLNRNDANDDTAYASATAPYGDVVLGIWDYSTHQFTPSLNGSQVNAVMTRYKTRLMTSLLRMWGMTSLSISAMSIATSDPASGPPPNGCTPPLGLAMCPFTGNNTFTSNGCGVAVKFTTSNAGADTGNTSAWVNLSGSGNPDPQVMKNQVNNAAGACNNPSPTLGEQLGTNGGQVNPAFQALEDQFHTKFTNAQTAGTNYTVLDKFGNPSYTGPGWELYVPVLGPVSGQISDMCTNDGQVNGQLASPLKVVGWTRFVVTQMWDSTGGNRYKGSIPGSNGQGCVVYNPADTATWQYCTTSPVAPPNNRAMWGYYNCAGWDAPPVEPTSNVPRTSLSEKLRLRR